MKKLFVWGFILCSMGTLAFGWGLHGEIANTNRLARNGEGYPFLIYPVVQGQPVRVYLQRLRAYTAEDNRAFMQSQAAGTLDTYLQEVGVLEPLNSPKFFAELKQAYNSWFSIMRDEFDEFPYEWKAFKDIAPIIRQGITIQQTQDPSQADVIVVLADDMSVGKRACKNQSRKDACFLQAQANDEIPHLVITNKPEERTNRGWLLKYAAGISLGLAPQIAPTKDNPGVQDEHPQYSMAIFRQSLMGGNPELTCDDMDGIVNLIDVTLYAKKEGDSKVFRWYPFGWSSFCLDGTHYMKGTPVKNLFGTPTGKGPYVVFKDSSQQGKSHFVLLTTRDQKQSKRDLEPSRTETYTPFSKKPKFYVDETDDKGRPVHSVSDDGLEKFYVYHHGLITRIVVQGNELLMLENRVHAPMHSSDSKQYLWQHSFVYVEGGKLKVLSLVVDPKTYDRQVVYYDDINTYSDKGDSVTASLTARPLPDGKYEIINEQPLPTAKASSSQPMNGYDQNVNITIALENKVHSASWEELRGQMLKFAQVE